ncbi:Crp/Fnr family transcriptional regulator [Bacteroidota bacterium]
MIEKLTFCPLFSGIKTEEIDQLLSTVHYRIKSYKQGELIVQSGDEVKNMLIILEGKVKGEMIDYKGKTIKIEDMGPGMPLASAFLFGKFNRYPVHITAISSVDLLVLPKESIIKIIQLNAIFLNNFLNIISNRAQFLSDKIKFLSFQTIKGKLANYLLEQLIIQQTNELFISTSQHELAELFGVTRPSLARAMRELDHEKLIKADGKRISILNKHGLIAYITL